MESEKGRVESLVLSIASPVSFFVSSTFPTLSNRDFKAAQACLNLIPEVWAVDSQSVFPDRILPLGNVDRDSGDTRCQSFQISPVVKGPAGKGFELWLPWGFAFKGKEGDWACSVSGCLCTTSNSPGVLKPWQTETCERLERSTGRASFLFESGIGGGGGSLR